MIRLTRQKGIPASFYRVSEYLTSSLCPKLTCRDQCGQHLRTNVGHKRSSPTWAFTRLSHCPNCHTSFNRDKAAAELIAYAGWHILVWGYHPFKAHCYRDAVREWDWDDIMPLQPFPGQEFPATV